MTLHCLVAAPPRPGLALPGLAAGPLTDEAAATLHAAALQDAMAAAEGSGGELLVTYPTEDRLPPGPAEATAEAELRGLADEALEHPDDVAFEAQVGETFAERATAAAAHLDDEGGEASVAVLTGTAPTLGRTALDAGAMRLRRVPVVVGPGTGGRVPYLGLGEPLELRGALDPPAVESLTDQAVEAGRAVEFLDHHPVLETPAGLASVVATVRARRRAGRPVPANTARAIDELGLSVRGNGDGVQTTG